MSRRYYRRPLLLIVILAPALVALRAALPFWVEQGINRKLSEMGDYSGRISGVDIDLWRGAYRLMDLNIVKTTRELPVPFFQVDVIDLSVSWPALLNGKVLAQVAFEQPRLNFVDTAGEPVQTGTGTDWREALKTLVPIRINQLRIDGGNLHFRNFDSEPPVDLRVTEIQGTIRDLNNLDRSQGFRPAAMSLEGKLMGQAPVSLNGHLDPLGDFRNFDFALEIGRLDLRHLNEIAEAYGNFDFQRGHGHLVMELTAVDGQLYGYAKLLLDNVEIVDLDKDLNEGGLSAAWETIVGALSWLFRNHAKDRIGSQIEIRGNLDDSEVSAWQAFVSILRNAFVDAYEAQYGRED